MSAEVTLTLPDGLWERAQFWADQSERPVADVLAEAIELSLLPLGQPPKPAGEWTNAEVLAAVDSQLSPGDDRQLSELLASQREKALSAPETAELHRLMRLYQEALLRKAIGLREAVRRGLRDAPKP